MRPLLTAVVLASTLLLGACGAATEVSPSDSVVITDPLSQQTQDWSVDRPTEAWFEELCTVLTILGPPFDQAPDQIGATLTSTGDTLLTTSSKLGAMPVPTFTGGSDYATTTVTALAEIGRAYQSAAEQWDDGRGDAARQTVEQILTDRSPDLSTLDPVVGTQLRNLPACQSVRSTF